MKAIVIGAVILAGTLLLWLVVPPILTQGPRSSAAAALQAAEARAKLASYRPGLAHAVDADALLQLKDADLQKLLDDAAAQAEKAAGTTKPAAEGEAGAEAAAEPPPASPFVAMSEEVGKRAEAARNADRALGLDEGKYAGVSMTGTGLKQAVDQVLELKKANDALLKDALRLAAEANQSGQQVLGVAQALGNAQFIEAAGQFMEATRLRTRLAQLHTELVALSARRQGLKAEADYYAALGTPEISQGLAAELEQLRQQAQAAAEAAAKLDAEVTQREAELTEARAELSKAQAELDALDTRGFKAGDDAAFSAFKQSYEQLAERLRTLQIREQELTSGGRQGATLAEDELESGQISGGTVLAGLEELKRRQAAAGTRAERLARGVQALERALQAARDSQADAARMQKEAAQRVQAVDGEAAKLLGEVNTAAADALAAEEAAIKAARDAAAAFKQSEAAGQAYINEARTVQGEQDPNRQNPRLRAILEENGAAAVGASGAAEAYMLLGRIYAQRLASLTRHVDVLALSAKAAGGEFKPGELETARTDAREAAINAVQEAIKRFNDLARAAGSTAWVPQASLAGAHHLLAQVDAGQEQAHRAAAVDALRKALEKRERSPYVAAYVQLRSQLTGEPLPAPGQSGANANANAGADEGDADNANAAAEDGNANQNENGG